MSIKFRNPDEDAWQQQTDWITNISLAQEIQQLIGRYAKTGQPRLQTVNDLISLPAVIATLVCLGWTYLRVDRATLPLLPEPAEEKLLPL